MALISAISQCDGHLAGPLTPMLVAAQDLRLTIIMSSRLWMRQQIFFHAKHYQWHI